MKKGSLLLLLFIFVHQLNAQTLTAIKASAANANSYYAYSLAIAFKSFHKFSIHPELEYSNYHLQREYRKSIIYSNFSIGAFANYRPIDRLCFSIGPMFTTRGIVPVRASVEYDLKPKWVLGYEIEHSDLIEFYDSYNNSKFIGGYQNLHRIAISYRFSNYSKERIKFDSRRLQRQRNANSSIYDGDQTDSLIFKKHRAYYFGMGLSLITSASLFTAYDFKGIHFLFEQKATKGYSMMLSAGLSNQKYPDVSAFGKYWNVNYYIGGQETGKYFQATYGVEMGIATRLQNSSSSNSKANTGFLAFQAGVGGGEILLSKGIKVNTFFGYGKFGFALGTRMSYLIAYSKN